MTVWQYTSDEIADNHTRYVLLKGGSRYSLRGVSEWWRPPRSAMPLILAPRPSPPRPPASGLGPLALGFTHRFHPAQTPSLAP